MLEHVGILWYDSRDGVIWSGRITLPRPLPAGISLQVVAVPQPLRSKTKEKYDLHIAIPLPEAPPEPPGPGDIRFKGEIMSQWFRPPKPSNRRHKILIWGLSGSAKTKSALEFPQCAYVDNHGSAEKYEAAYSQHLFFGSATEPPTPDNTMAAVTSLISDPGDRRTLVLDDITTYWDQIQAKWSKLFLARLPQSKGHHAEFYTLQPSDWVHPKRELRSLVRRMIALDTNVVVIARAQKEYAGEGGNFMKVIGEIFAGEKNLVYEFDYVFQLVHEGGKYLAVVHKQRITPGEKPMPESFEFSIDEQGRSTFYDIFSGYVDKERLNQAPHQVADPEGAPEGPSAYQQMAQTVAENYSPPIPGPQPAPPPTTPPTPAPGAILTPGAGASETTATLITTDQLNQLVALKAEYKIENPEWGQTLAKFYNVTTAKVLSHEQADHFINYLKTQRVPF